MSPLLYRGPSLRILHEQYAKQGRIDEGAAVTAARSVRIDATPRRVWQVLSAAESWPDFAPAISAVDLPRGVAPDAAFAWTNGRARIKSRFAIVEPQRELTWTGVSSGARAVHRNVLQPLNDHQTQLQSAEFMAGLLLSLFYNSKKLSAALEDWLMAVKAAAEHQPRASSPRSMRRQARSGLAMSLRRWSVPFVWDRCGGLPPKLVRRLTPGGPFDRQRAARRHLDRLPSDPAQGRQPPPD
jgi:hypothetical protein